MVRRACENDVNAAAKLAALLWEGHTADALAEEFSALIESPDAAIFLQYVGGEPVGFAQCQLRHDYVEGTQSSPVGYLEGIFVKEEFRKRGFARELLSACEQWAKERHCTEFACDCELSNTDSLRFHTKMGFREANRIICFTKRL